MYIHMYVCRTVYIAPCMSIYTMNNVEQVMQNSSVANLVARRQALTLFRVTEKVHEDFSNITHLYCSLSAFRFGNKKIFSLLGYIGICQNAQGVKRKEPEPQ